MARIYMDHHATAPTDPRVVEAMLPWFTDHPGNPASPHLHGWEAAEAVDQAAGHVAALLGVEGREIVWTAGATESNNLALRGAVAATPGPARVVTTTLEHPSVLEPLHALARDGVEVVEVGPRTDGIVDVGDVLAELRPGTTLCSVQWANGEIGTLQPVDAIAAACRERGIAFHTDATQAVGRIPVDAGIADLVSLSGHKFHGPKGIGALVHSRRKPRIRLEPLLQGGGQQRGLRPGTVPVPLVVGLGEACRLAREEMAATSTRVAALRDDLRARLWAGLPDLRENGDPARRLPGNLSVAFLGVEAQAILLELRDVALSSASACSADRHEPSPVLLAIGLDGEQAHSTIRFGLGAGNTAAEVEEVARRVIQAVSELRARTPATLARRTHPSEEEA